MHRPDLLSLAANERTTLAASIQQYVTPAIVNQHLSAPLGVHNDGATFLSWHRAYIAGLEAFLVDQGHPEWSPLPAWDPATRIPPEFNVPGQGVGKLVNLNPGISFSPTFDHERLANFETDGALGDTLMGIHGTVHIEVGGVMASFRSPSAPIFWCWHSFIDDIWWGWQRGVVVVPTCLGLSQAEAVELLTALGLVVGNVATQPHVDLPFIERPPMVDIFPPFLPFPPRPGPWPAWPFPQPQPRPWPPRRRPHRHVVLDQSPDPGERLHHNSAVDLVLGRP